MATLEETLAAVEAMQESDVALFEAMARNAADGEVVDPKELQKVLISTGQDLNDFRRLVSVFKRRTQLRQDIIYVGEANQRIVDLKSQIQEFNAELEKHVAEHQAKCRPVQREISDLKQTITEKCDAPRELLDSCPSDSLKFKLRIATDRKNTALQEMQKEDAYLRRVEADIPRQPPGFYDYRIGKINERISELREQHEQAQADEQAALQAMRDY